MELVFNRGYVMPMGPYKDFAACVTAQKNKGRSTKSAEKICGYIKHKVEGQALTEEQMKAIESDAELVTKAEEWFSKCLGSEKNV